MTCFVTPKMNPHCKKSQQDLLRQTTTRTTTKDRRRKTKDDDGVDTNKDYGDDRDTDDVVRSSFCHSLLHDNDLVVNPTKAKQLTNIRAAGSDENLLLTPPIRFSLEQALEFIDDDELVEVTPASIRLRKKILAEGMRKREARQRAS